MGDDLSDGRSIFLQWLKNRLDHPTSAGISSLHHYTNANGLDGVLKSGSLWATDTRFLNDSAEFSYGKQLFFDALVEESLKRADSVAEWVRLLVDPESGVLESWIAHNYQVYVACFCEDGDLLSQWRAYGGSDRFGGYSIEFTPPSIFGWGQGTPHNFTMRKVVYSRDEQEDVCHSLIQPLLDYFEVEPSSDARQRSFSSAVADGVGEIASWLKHPAFAEEREWRLTYTPLIDHSQRLKTEYRASNGLFVPYVVVPVPATMGAMPELLPIKSITCGPSEDAVRKSAGVQGRLESAYAAVHVLDSAAPARI